MSNFDLNDYLYNNPLYEDEDKKADKEIEDVFKDAVEDFADELPDVKANVKEAAPLVVAGASLAVPEILKIIGKISKKFSSVIGRTGNTGEKIIKVADKLHGALTGVIKKALRAMGAKEGSALDKIVDGLYHLLVASLMLASGAGSVKAFKAGKIAMSTLEAGLAAVKSNEVGRFLQDLIGSGTIGEMDGEDYDPDAEQDDENVGMGYDDEGRPLGEDKDPRQIEAENELRDEAMLYFLRKVRSGEIDVLPKNPLQAYMDMLTQTAIDKDDEKLRRELGEGQRGDSKAGYSISDFTDRLDSIKMTTGNDYITNRFKVDDEVILRGNSTVPDVLKVTGVFPHKIDGKTADEMVYRVEFPNGDDAFYYDSELSLNPFGKKDKVNERLNVSRDALKRLYNEVGATTFSQMILELRDENALDDLVEALSYQYSGIMREGLTIGGKKVKAIHTHNSNDVEDHTIEYEDGTEEPYLKHIQMKEARDYRMTYPSYKVEEFNDIGDMAHNGILNLMSFAEQHKPEVVSKIKAVAEEVMNLIYDDMEEFDTQPRISVKEKKGKDHDGDGDIDSDDYLAAKDKAIKKAMKSETKSAPKGHYFTKSGNLVKGRITKDARERGATISDPLDKRRSKVPPVSQVREEDEPTAGQIKSSGGSLASIAGKLAKVAKDMKGLAKEYKAAKEAGDDKKVKDLLATLKVLTAHKKQLEKDLDNA